MILFVDDGRVRRKARSRNPDAVTELEVLLDSLGPYRDLVEVIVAAPWATGRTLAQLRADLAPHQPDRISGNLWDDPPPCALSRYDHINYWLTRRHVWPLPTWLALAPEPDDWPAERRDRFVGCVGGIGSEGNQRELRARLERYYWADLWWGEGPAPDVALRSQAHALMVAWSIPRRRWPEFLGRTAHELEQRLELLLKVHAAAQRHVGAGVWYAHWVHLPRAALDMRRPVEVIATEGLAGIGRVLKHVWDFAPPMAGDGARSSKAG
ncbi:hypothetical protein ACFFGH_16515 [Lysobacter korlensis]|uniref:DUF2384 domain-containing protein n=1 Tax=Lysobacter korlensis TaxID=553636 RepID=A0ABV6RRM6_9GAMM